MKEAAYEYAISIDTAAGVINMVENTNYRDKITFLIEKGQVNVKEDLNFSLHVGADADMTNKIGVGIKALDTAGLGIRGLNVKDSAGAAATYAIDSIADAIATVSSQRSLLGAVQNRLEHTINNLDNVVENTTSAESQIRDTDMAAEMVKYSNANILSQAGQSMLAQGNQSSQGVLSLLGWSLRPPPRVQRHRFRDNIFFKIPRSCGILIQIPAIEDISLPRRRIGCLDQFAVHALLALHRCPAHGVKLDAEPGVGNACRHADHENCRQHDDNDIERSDRYIDFGIQPPQLSLRGCIFLILPRHTYLRTRYLRMSIAQAIRMIRPLMI